MTIGDIQNGVFQKIRLGNILYKNESKEKTLFGVFIALTTFDGLGIDNEKESDTCGLQYPDLSISKADLMMAFAERLSWYRKMGNASPMIFESQFTVSQRLNPSGSE